MAFCNTIGTLEREWDIESTILLISLFKENECLYNNTHKDYTNTVTRRDITCKIANVIYKKTGEEFSIADVQKKLSSLRAQYLAEKQKIITSNNTIEEYTADKYWYPLLKFLDSYPSPDLSKSTLESAHASNEPVLFLFQPQNNIEPQPPKPPRRRKKPQLDNVSLSNFAISQPVANVPRNPTDLNPHITTFCGFIKSELVSIKETGGEEFLKKAKRRVQLALFEVWDEMEMENLNDDLE